MERLEMVSMVLFTFEKHWHGRPCRWTALQMEGMGGCHGPTRAGGDVTVAVCLCMCVCLWVSMYEVVKVC